MKGGYELDPREGPRARLDDAEIVIREFTVTDRATGETALAVPKLHVRGITIRYPEQTAHVDSVSSTGARIALKRLADGSLRVEQLSRMESADAASEPVPEDDADSAGTGAPWTYAIDLIEFEAGSLQAVLDLRFSTDLDVHPRGVRSFRSGSRSPASCSRVNRSKGMLSRKASMTYLR